MRCLGVETLARFILIFGSQFPHVAPSFGELLIRCLLLIVALRLPTSAASAAFSAFPAPVGALWPATRLIDIQFAAVELSTIQFGDRLVRISRAGHLHERRPARLTRISVSHDTYAIDRTISCEQLAQLVFTGLVVKVPTKMSFMWMPSVELFERRLMSAGRTGDLEPSSNQAGSGEQFKRGCKYNKQGGLPFENKRQGC
jgi:hypothetical protein